MKKILLVLIITISFNQIKIIAQGCSDYFEIRVHTYDYDFQSDNCNNYPYLRNVRIYYDDDGNGDFNMMYNGSPSDLNDSIIYSNNSYPDNGQIRLVIYYDDCVGQKGCEGFGDKTIEIPSGMTEFSWFHWLDEVEANAYYGCDSNKKGQGGKGWVTSSLVLDFEYRVRPPNPTEVHNISDLNCNDNDTIQLSVSGNVNPLYTWKYSLDGYSSILGTEQIHTEILDNLNNNSVINLNFKVWSGIDNRLSCNYGLSPTFAVYPRRPKITSAYGEAPSCYGAGDGKFIIGSIDGAVAGDAVDAYKITFARGECPDNLSGNLEDIISGNINVMPFNGGSESIRYLDKDTQYPVTFTVDSFYQDANQDIYTNPIEGDSIYCILLENAYVDTSETSALINGASFYQIRISKKDSLSANIQTSRLLCNGDTNGEIKITVNGGNPKYSAQLFNSDSIMIEKVKGLCGQIIPDVDAEYTFTGGGDLPADTYYIRLIDENNCNVWVNSTESNSNIIENIVVTQPDSLKTTIRSEADRNRVLCKGDSTAVISFNISGGNQFKYQSSSGTVDDNKTTYKYSLYRNDSIYSDLLPMTDTLFRDSIFPAGNYRLRIYDAHSCPVFYSNAIEGNAADSFLIPEPDKKLSLSADIFNYNGYGIKCHGDSTGRVTLIPEGGNGGYYFSDNSAYFENTDSIFNYLSAGTHKFYLTDSSYILRPYRYCTDSVIITLNEPDTLLIDSIALNDYNGFNIRCTGFQDSLIVYASGGISDSVYQYGLFGSAWDMSNVLKVNYGSDGIKEIWIKDANECTDSITVILTQPESEPAIASIDTVSYHGFGVKCFGDTNGQLIVRPLQGSGTIVSGEYYTFSINNQKPFQTDSVFTGLPAGYYTLTIKDANGCLSADSTAEISEPDSLKATAADIIEYNSYNISCKNGSDGGFVINGTGGVSDYQYFLNGIQIANDTVKNKPAGEYLIKITDANNCISETDTVILIEPDALTFSVDTNTYTGNHAIRCFGMTDSVKVKVFGGCGDYGTYLKNNSDSIFHGITNSGDSAYFNISANLNYGLNIKDKNGCILDSANIFSVTQPDEMKVLDLSTDSTLCSNTTDGSLSIRWSGGSNNYTYYLKKYNEFIDTLYNNDTITVSTFEGLGKATYSVVAEDENNCLDTSITIFIYSPEPLISNNEITNPDCYGDTLGTLKIFDVTGGTTNNSGYYDFYVKTSYGDSIFIPDTGTALFENVGLGTHYYFITDDNNCVSDSVAFNITEPDEMIMSTTIQNVSAQGGSDGSVIADVQGGTGTYNRYKWRNSNNEIIAENVNNIENLPAGDYSVEVWDTNDCPYGNSNNGLIQYFTVYEPGQALELYIVQQHNVSTPGGNDGSVSLDANGGWGQYLYKKGADGIYTPANLFTDLAAGTYWFFVKDEYDMKDSVQTTVTEAEELIIENINIQNVVCNGDNNGKATITVSGGTLPYLYSLNNIDFYENNTFENLVAGTYTAYVKDIYGNSANQNFAISQPDELTVQITDVQNTTCGSADGSLTANPSGGTAPYTYNWYLNGVHIGQYDAVAVNLEAGLYTVEITDANSCTNSAQAVVSNSNGPQIESIITAGASCYNTSDGSATISNITASGSYTIQWSTGQTDVMNINNLQAGNYNVIVEDENNCSATEVFTIEAPAELSFTFNTNSPTCYNGCNGSIIANLSGGSTPYTLEWQNISDNPSSNFVGNLCAGEYILNVTDANNCFYTGTANLENPEQITILQNHSATLCQGQSITLDAGNPGSSYQWTSDNGFQSNEQNVTLNEAGNYNITVFTPEGCVAEDNFTLNFNENFLEANFLMQSEAEIGDTVVLVEISWETPDSVSWNFPNGLWVLSQSEENVQLIPVQNGVQTVGLTAYLGSCSDYIEKYINISGNQNKNFVIPEYLNDEQMQFKSVKLYPNPNNGYFTLDISLYEKDDVQIEIYDILGQLQQAHKIGKGEKNYTFNFNLNNLKNGLYFISIKTNKGTAGVKFMKQ